MNEGVEETGCFFQIKLRVEEVLGRWSGSRLEIDLAHFIP